MDPIYPWAVDGPIRSPFALPQGLLGRLAGLFMRWKNDPSDVFPLLEIARGASVLEVGYGPGRLVRMIAEQSEARAITGIDPSPDMLKAAVSYNRRHVDAGLVELRLGTAAESGIAGRTFDRIVSLHTVALWPSLEAGLDELARLLAPDGRLVLAWHGGRKTTRLAKKLALPDDKLARLERELRARFRRVEAFEQDRDVVFRAGR